MQLKITIEWIDNATTQQREIAVVERDQLSAATCGLNMAEAKAILAGVQQAMVTAQTADYLRQHDRCEHCGANLRRNGQHNIVLRTLFGKLRLPSPRYRTCCCQEFSSVKKTLSPLAAILPERTTPELSYLECKWAALLSYGMTTQLLGDLLPLDKPISTAVLSRQVRAVAERSEAELGTEALTFMAASPRRMAQLPLPPEPLTVGIDGGWVHGREGQQRKAGSFELIVGKSMTQAGDRRRFGFVNGYDKKPRRRIFELLRAQGMQANQQVTFLSDGGDTVRGLQRYLNPQGEYLLDWFHLTMRITQLRQMVSSKVSRTEDKEASQHDAAYIVRQLERTKWYLWHGNVDNGMKVLQSLKTLIKIVRSSEWQEPRWFKKLADLIGYLAANREYIVNYGDRYRNGECISTAFVESTVNELISRRMVKKQQMRWTKAGAHRLLQLRVQVLDGVLRGNFERWYPGTHIDTGLASVAA